MHKLCTYSSAGVLLQPFPRRLLRLCSPAPPMISIASSISSSAQHTCLPYLPHRPVINPQPQHHQRSALLQAPSSALSTHACRPVSCTCPSADSMGCAGAARAHAGLVHMWQARVTCCAEGGDGPCVQLQGPQPVQQPCAALRHALPLPPAALHADPRCELPVRQHKVPHLPLAADGPSHAQSSSWTLASAHRLHALPVGNTLMIDPTCC